MIVHDSWWSNGGARSTIIDYHEPFDQGLRVPKLAVIRYSNALGGFSFNRSSKLVFPYAFLTWKIFIIFQVVVVGGFHSGCLLFVRINRLGRALNNGKVSSKITKPTERNGAYHLQFDFP